MPKRRYYKRRPRRSNVRGTSRNSLSSFGRLVRQIMSPNKSYRFVQLCPDFTVAQTAGAATLQGLSFDLNKLDQVSSFTALFDAFRVEAVEYTFRPMFTATSLIGAGLPGILYLSPLIYTVIDLDDGSNPSSLATLREYGTCKVHDDKHVFKVGPFTPRIGADAGGIGGAFQLGMQWIDAANPSLAHYGIKLGITPGVAGQTSLQVWNVTTRAIISFKNVR